MKRIRGIFPALIATAFITGPASAAEPNPHNSLECVFCHDDTPRFGVDTRETVGFYRFDFDDPELCFICHSPVENLHPVGVTPGPDAAATRTPEHLPLATAAEREGQVVCVTCHFIHAASAGKALLRGFTGSQDPGRFERWQDLCRECHGEGLEQRSPHQGDDRACAFCHQSVPEEGKPVTVVPRGTALCNFCHGAFQNGHYEGANPFEGPVTCVTCHDPHLGEGHTARLRPEYFAAFGDSVTIDPHYRRALCAACHPDGESAPLRPGGPVYLCNRCHGTASVPGDIHPLRKVPEGFAIPAGWPLQEGYLTCTTCHLAGHPDDAGRYKFLRGVAVTDRSDFCDNCHDRAGWEGKNPHGEAAENRGCEWCHEERPLEGRPETGRLLADPNILCLRCHSGAEHPMGRNHTFTLSPARAAAIPEEFPLSTRRMTCATCHDSHLAGKETHKLRGPAEGLKICARCHTI